MEYVAVCDSKFVYPKADEVEEKYVVEDADGRVIGTGDGQYEVFSRVDSAIRESVKDLLEGEKSICCILYNTCQCL